MSRKSALSLQLTEAYFESVLSDQSLAQSWNHESHFRSFDGTFCLFPVLATNTGTWMTLPRTSLGKAGKHPFHFGIPSLHHRAFRFVSPLYEFIPKYFYISTTWKTPKPKVCLMNLRGPNLSSVQAVALKHHVFHQVITWLPRKDVF